MFFKKKWIIQKKKIENYPIVCFRTLKYLIHELF